MSKRAAAMTLPLAHYTFHIASQGGFSPSLFPRQSLIALFLAEINHQSDRRLIDAANGYFLPDT